MVREKPCTTTAAGVPLLRLAAQTALLEAEALSEMCRGKGTLPRIALAVNADSMATWFTGVFDALDDVFHRYPDRASGPLSAAAPRRDGDGGGDDGARAGVGLSRAAIGSDAVCAGGKPAYLKCYLSEGFTARAVVAAPSLAWNRDDAPCECSSLVTTTPSADYREQWRSRPSGTGYEMAGSEIVCGESKGALESVERGSAPNA